jgi:opacity protein-like surface antigen
MNARLLGTAGLATVLAAATPAQADGIYIGAFGGVNFAQDSDFSYDPGGGYDVELDVQHDTGWLAGAAVGYAFDFGLRAEAEAAYRMNDFDQFEIAGFGYDLDGDVSTLSLMGNLWFEAPLTAAFRPFVGVGVGMAQVSLNDVEAPVIGPGTFVDDSDWVFAYQVGGGVAYRFTPGWDVTAEYRYFATDDAEVGVEGTSGDGEYEYSSHSVLLGVRYTFQ